jgi:hypothetical protein
MSDHDDSVQNLKDAVILLIAWYIFYAITMWIAKLFVPEDEDGNQNRFLVGLVWCIEIAIMMVCFGVYLSPPYHESQNYTPAQWRTYIDRKCVQYRTNLSDHVNLQVEPPTVQIGVLTHEYMTYWCMPVDGGDMPLKYKEYERDGGNTEQLKFPEEWNVYLSGSVDRSQIISNDPKKFNVPRLHYIDNTKQFNTYRENNK